jgi:hypothetical protein
MIDEYHSGEMTISGKTYYGDIIADWNGNIGEWQAGEADGMGLEDLIPALEKNPEVIVAGTGEKDSIKVSPEVFDYLKEKKIKLFADKTREAVRTFNILKENSLEEEGYQCKVVGFFHLT